MTQFVLQKQTIPISQTMTDEKKINSAKKLLVVAERLLNKEDRLGTLKFAAEAKEMNPNIEGYDQIIAASDVQHAATKICNNQKDWYAILQVERKCNDVDLIRKQYKRLSLLLHSDKIQFTKDVDTIGVFRAEFDLIREAWLVVSDPLKKNFYDMELDIMTRVEAVEEEQRKRRASSGSARMRARAKAGAKVATPTRVTPVTPVRHSPRKRKGVSEQSSGSVEGVKVNGGVNNGNGKVNPVDVDTEVDEEAEKSRLRADGTFWTLCPYCYNLFEYPKMFVDCALECQNCKRVFHAVVIEKLLPFVPGEEAYFCTWGFFPMSFSEVSGNGVNASVPTSLFTPVFSAPGQPPKASDPNSGNGIFSGPSGPAKEQAGEPVVGNGSGVKRDRRVAKKTTMNVKMMANRDKRTRLPGRKTLEKGPNRTGGVDVEGSQIENIDKDGGMEVSPIDVEEDPMEEDIEEVLTEAERRRVEMVDVDVADGMYFFAGSDGVYHSLPNGKAST